MIPDDLLAVIYEEPRPRILVRLYKGPCTPSLLTRDLGFNYRLHEKTVPNRARVSRHLKVLLEHGLVVKQSGKPLGSFKLRGKNKAVQKAPKVSRVTLYSLSATGEKYVREAGLV